MDVVAILSPKNKDGNNYKKTKQQVEEEKCCEEIISNASVTFITIATLNGEKRKPQYINDRIFLVVW